MTNASIDSDHVAWQEFDSSVIKINEEATFQRQEALIGIRMTVPMVTLGHGAYTNFMIIDTGD
jgi:hypothetical protein